MGLDGEMPEEEEEEEEEGFKDEISKEAAAAVGEVTVAPPICAEESCEKEAAEEEEEEVVTEAEMKGKVEEKDEGKAGVSRLEEQSQEILPSNDTSFEMQSLRWEYASDDEDERLVPVELIDSTTLTGSTSRISAEEDDGEELGQIRVEKLRVTVTVDVGTVLDDNVGVVRTVEVENDEAFSRLLETEDKTEETCCPLSPSEESNGGSCYPEQIQEIFHASAHEVEAAAMEVHCEETRDTMASEVDDKLLDPEASCEVSIGSEICDQEQIDQAPLQDSIPPLIDLHDQSLGNHNEATDVDHVIEIESVEVMDGGINHQLSMLPEHNEVEEERLPETPTYVEGFHNLHKRFLFERREYGTESLDGSVASELEGSSDILTVDHLKAALKAERKALSALYSELEEERSASAIAANQTMAMITRLQEEKAAMQMEALQYQRMMDEQSEYDQEALQLLNELMMKREKEKQDLEKQLELCRKKVLLYEAKERRRLKRVKADGRSGTSSACSSAEDSDDLSFELNNDGDENFYGPRESNQNTPGDTVLSSATEEETDKHLCALDESLADFEEERLSILEQLKVLEDKLFTLDDGEILPENTEAIEHFREENGHGHASCGDYEFWSNGINGSVNDFSANLNANGKHQTERRNLSSAGKRLLPLFDAVSTENEHSLVEELETTQLSQGSLSKFTSEQKKLAIAEEVDNVYERLQALEGDREFLKHCISSLKKGDKGMDLLQEILQHLRDLRTVELQVRSAGDVLASLSA